MPANTSRLEMDALLVDVCCNYSEGNNDKHSDNDNEMIMSLIMRLTSPVLLLLLLLSLSPSLSFHSLCVYSE